MSNKCHIPIESFSDVTTSCGFMLLLSGDLKLVEKPQSVTMAPHDFTNIKASVKVASTENGIIFGNIGVYMLYRRCTYTVDTLCRSTYLDMYFILAPFIKLFDLHLLRMTCRCRVRV